jgi:hypothetical protein
MGANSYSLQATPDHCQPLSAQLSSLIGDIRRHAATVCWCLLNSGSLVTGGSGQAVRRGQLVDYPLRRISSTVTKLSTSELSTAFPFSADPRDGRPITPLRVYSSIPVVRRWRRSSATQSAAS